MKYSQFKRELSRLGAEFDTQGKGSHITVYYRGRRSTFPFHGSKEMPEPLRKGILKQPGLKL